MSEAEAVQAKHLEHLQETKVSKQNYVYSQVGLELEAGKSWWIGENESKKMEYESPSGKEPALPDSTGESDREKKLRKGRTRW